ncbi:MAG: hypothetical protein AB8G26_01890 [Ilumatobacter sp.]
MSDLTIFLIVLLLRLFVPLLILRYPLPAIVFALVLDAADQTIFQAWTDLDLTTYQSYDKALDVFYLAIAYIATFRNWRNPTAIAAAVFLWYYRLIGVTLFELTEWRPLLLIFPNTFEYYFIAIAVVRLRWSDRTLSPRTVVTIAACIWVFIKLPQEWWIHIAQLDFTDFVKGDLLGVEVTDSFADGFANRPLVGLAMLALVVLFVGIVAFIWRRAPEPDHAFTFDADKVAKFDDRPAPAVPPVRPWLEGLAEKVALITLMSIIFGRAIPGSNASIPEVLLFVALLVAANAGVSQWLRQRGHEWSSVGRAFGGNVIVNAVLFYVLTVIIPSSDEGSSALAIAFFLFLLSLIIALFDRYRPTRGPLHWSLQPIESDDSTAQLS